MAHYHTNKRKKTWANLVPQLKNSCLTQNLHFSCLSSQRQFFSHRSTAFCSTEKISVHPLFTTCASLTQIQPGVLVQHVRACCVRAVMTNQSEAGSELTGVEIDEAWVLLLRLLLLLVGDCATGRTSALALQNHHRSLASQHRRWKGLSA